MSKYTYKEKKPLDKEESSLDIRHLPIAGGGAQIIGLLGGSKEDQVEANWDAWKLNGGTIGGGLGGMVLGGLLGHSIGKSLGSGNPLGSWQSSHGGTQLGAIIGGLAGSILGNYITFKTMAKNRNVDADYDIRHFPLWGKSAQIAALHGYSPEDQIESNWNRLKIRVPANLAGQVANKVIPEAEPLVKQLAQIGMYDVLRKNRLQDDK